MWRVWSNNESFGLHVLFGESSATGAVQSAALLPMCSRGAAYREAATQLATPCPAATCPLQVDGVLQARGTGLGPYAICQNVVWANPSYFQYSQPKTGTWPRPLTGGTHTLQFRFDANNGVPSGYTLRSAAWVKLTITP